MGILGMGTAGGGVGSGVCGASTCSDRTRKCPICVAGGKTHGRGKTAVALMLLIINALAQLTGVFLVPVSCAIWLIVSYLAATLRRYVLTPAPLGPRPAPFES